MRNDIYQKLVMIMLMLKDAKLLLLIMPTQKEINLKLQANTLMQKAIPQQRLVIMLMLKVMALLLLESALMQKEMVLLLLEIILMQKE